MLINKQISNSQELTDRIFELLKEVPWLKINGYSAFHLHKIAMGNTSTDYVIVESARNEPFDMFVNDVKAMVSIMEKSPRGRTIYAYRVNGIEKFFFYPIVNKMNSAFEWLPIPEDKNEKSKTKADKKPVKRFNSSKLVYTYIK